MHHQLLTPHHLLTVDTNPSRARISSTFNPEDWNKKFLRNITIKLPSCNTMSDPEKREQPRIPKNLQYKFVPGIS